MKTNKLIFIGKSTAIAILILGIIHDIATFTPLIKEGLLCLTPDNLRAMIYMSLICGTSFILSGLLLIMLLKKLEQFSFLASPIMFIGTFLAISGILSVIYMFENPFAWIGLVLNMIIFGITLRLKFEFAKK